MTIILDYKIMNHHFFHKINSYQKLSNLFRILFYINTKLINHVDDKN